MSFYSRNFGVMTRPVVTAGTMTMLPAASLMQRTLATARPPVAVQPYQESAVAPEGTFLQPQPESFFDQYGTLLIAGGAGVALLVLGFVLLKKPSVKKATAGYRRRRRR